MARSWAVFHAFGFILIGIIYFALLYWAVEIYLVRKKVFTDYELKIVDFLWTCLSGVALFLLFISTRENTFKDQIDPLEQHSSEIQQAMNKKYREAPDECMAGKWPPGAIKGKTYSENGNQLTEACDGAATVTQLMLDFFNDPQVWQTSLSLDSRDRFSKKFDQVFGTTFPQRFASFSTPPLEMDTLAREAFEYYRDRGLEVVQLKQKAGRLSFEQSVVHGIVSHTSYWPFLLATVFAFILGKSRLELLVARRASPQRLRSPATDVLVSSSDVSSSRNSQISRFTDQPPDA